MLVSEFIAAAGPVRPTLQDLAGNRWSDDTLRSLTTDAVRRIFMEHPETRVAANYERRGVPSDTLAAGEPVPVDDLFLEPLARYVCFLAFSRDSKDEGNRAQAAQHLETYNDFFNGG